MPNSKLTKELNNQLFQTNINLIDYNSIKNVLLSIGPTITKALTPTLFDEYKKLLKSLSSTSLLTQEIKVQTLIKKLKENKEYSLQIFSDNLKYYLDINNETMKSISNKLEIGYSTINDWCHGRAYPSSQKIKLLADYFDITISDLIEEEHEEEYTNNKTTSINKDIFLNIEDISNYKSIPQNWNNSNSLFSLKLLNDKMSPDYIENDIIIFEKSTEFINGKICAAITGEGKIFFSKLFVNDAGIIFQFLNENYDPIFYNKKEMESLQIKILGYATEIRRKISN